MGLPNCPAQRNMNVIFFRAILLIYIVENWSGSDNLHEFREVAD